LKGFAKKGATLAQNEVSQATSTDRLLEGHFVKAYPLLARRHILQECVKLVQRNINNSIRIRERKDTVWWCPDCKVPLCMPECFKLYHTELNNL